MQAGPARLGMVLLLAASLGGVAKADTASVSAVTTKSATLAFDVTATSTTFDSEGNPVGSNTFAISNFQIIGFGDIRDVELKLPQLQLPAGSTVNNAVLTVNSPPFSIPLFNAVTTTGVQCTAPAGDCFDFDGAPIFAAAQFGSVNYPTVQTQIQFIGNQVPGDSFVKPLGSAFNVTSWTDPANSGQPTFLPVNISIEKFFPPANALGLQITDFGANAVTTGHFSEDFTYGGTSTLTVDYTPPPTATPEPGGSMLLVVGGLGLLPWIRRKVRR